jgi:hypothetical protein
MNRIFSTPAPAFRAVLVAAAFFAAAITSSATASVITVGTPADEVPGPTVNSSGVTIGYATPGNVPPYSFVTVPGQAPVTLPPGPFPAAIAYGINDAGYVVGGPFHAVLWNPTDYTAAPVDLDAWLDSVDPVAGAKWTLTHAVSISDDGIIVGEGQYIGGPGTLADGNSVFLLDASSLVTEPVSSPVPEPASLAFPLLAAASLRRTRRRRA